MTTPRPVTDYENEQSKGFALCADHVFDHQLEKINKLRRQEAAYRDSLPTGDEAAKEVRGILAECDDTYSPLRQGAYALIILEELLLHGSVEECPSLVRAMAFLAGQGRDAVWTAQAELDRAYALTRERSL